MAKSNIEIRIEEAAAAFALQIIEAVRNATLHEMMDLQGAGESVAAAPRRGRRPGQKPGQKPAKKPVKKQQAEKKVDGRRNRIVKNYPKCAYPKCKNNRFPRGKGFCGEHWRMWQEGKIKSAEEYKKS